MSFFHSVVTYTAPSSRAYREEQDDDQETLNYKRIQILDEYTALLRGSIEPHANQTRSGSKLSGADRYFAIFTHYEGQTGKGRTVAAHVHVVWYRTGQRVDRGVITVLKKCQSSIRTGDVDIGTGCTKTIDFDQDRVHNLASIRLYLEQGGGRVKRYESLGGELPIEEIRRQYEANVDREILQSDFNRFGRQCDGVAISGYSTSDLVHEGLDRKYKEGYQESISTMEVPTARIKRKRDGEPIMANDQELGMWLMDMAKYYNVFTAHDLETRLTMEKDRKIFDYWSYVQFQRRKDQLVTQATESMRKRILTKSFIELAAEAYTNERNFKIQYNTMSLDESYEWIIRILNYQFNNVLEDIHEFVGTAIRIMDKYLPKINTLYFEGPANAGKTMVALSMARVVRVYADKCNFTGSNDFIFQDFIDCRCILMNEGKITDGCADQMKNIMEGHETHVERKHKMAASIKRTPVLITANQPIDMYLSQTKQFNGPALKTRMKHTMWKCMPELKECKGSLHPGIWFLIARDLYDYDNTVHYAQDDVFIETIKQYME